MTRKEIQEKQKQLDIEKENLRKKELEESEKRRKSSKASRDKARIRQEQLEPFIRTYVTREIKEKDIIRCKGYRGAKKVVQIRGDEKWSNVIALCGWINRKTGEFEPNGSGSETYSGNVIEVLRDGKFVKVKDLIKDYKF